MFRVTRKKKKGSLDPQTLIILKKSLQSQKEKTNTMIISLRILRWIHITTQHPSTQQIVKYPKVTEGFPMISITNTRYDYALPDFQME